MKATEDKYNENGDISEDLSTSSLQDKAKSKRRIINPFKRLSLKRTKSVTNRYSILKSESQFSIQRGDSKFENAHEHKFSQNIIQETRMYSKRNPFISETTEPYTTACTSKTIQSVVIFPNDFEDLPVTVDDRPSHLIFNPSDLPAVSDLNRNPLNHPTTSYNQHKDVFDCKSSQTHKPKKNIEQKIKKSINNHCNIVPTNFISYSNNNLNINLTLALKEVLELSNYLQENEVHLKHLIAKYIQNENLKQDLLEAMSSHIKTQVENERRAHKLAQDMFHQESEAQKTKEKALQNSLDVVVNINRLLEDEIESLKSEHEKTFVEYDKESSSCAYHKKYEEDILKNNNDMRIRLKHLISEIKRLENELKNLQFQNECLLNQVATATTQTRNYKDMLQKSMGDHEVEQSALLQQITNYEQIMKASIDAGDILFDELEAIKKQLKQMPFAINWSKFNCRGNTVIDLLHLARSCTNELCRELINTHMQISFGSQDRETKNIEIMKLNQELQEVKTNDTNLQLKVDNLSSLEIELQVKSHKISLLETELAESKKEHSLIVQRFYEEKNVVSNITKDLQSVNSQLAAKDLDISKLNTKVFDVITENSSLKCRLESMKKLLEESKLSKVVTELLETQEKCAYHQAQFYQMEIDKNNLTEQLKMFDEERNNLLKSQQSYYEHLQLQQKDIANLNRENSELKDQLKLNTGILNKKNVQLFQQIQESNLMKTVQSQFSSEISKNHVLESNALNTNFEMNRLTVVAEYNNMISQQLKSALDSKDNIITELQSSVVILNNEQKKNIEEKSVLCQELTEASYIIKQFQKDLTKEKEKLHQISTEKINMQKDSEIQVEELHKILIEERKAARELINNHKNLTTQRNNLLSQQKEYLTEIASLKANEGKLELIQEQCETKCHKYEQQCEIISNELQESNKKIEQNYQKARNSAIEYENKLSLRDCFIENLKSEKDELENTVKYLQNNIKKLQIDLDELRNSEKDYKDQLASNLESLSKCQKRSDDQRQILEQCNSEQKILEQKLSEALISNNELLNEYNSSIINNRTKEEKLQKDVKTLTKLNETKTRSIECLAKDSKERIKLLEQRQVEYEVLKEHLHNFEEIQKDLDEKSKLLENSLDRQHKLNEKILKLVPENENCQKTIKQHLNVINLLRTQLEYSFKSREKEIEFCKSFMDELTTETKRQKQDMLNDLHNLSTKMRDMESKLTEKSLQNENLKSNYKNTVEQLTNTVSILLEERNLRENKDTEIELLKIEIHDMNSKLEQSNSFIFELNKIKSKADTIFEKEDFLQDELEETKKLYSVAKVDCKTFEIQLKETTEKLQRLEEFSQMEEGYAMKELANKSELLKMAENNIETLESRVKKFRLQMQATSEIIIQLKSEISRLYQQNQILDFQKCELTLRYHELNVKYVSEKNLNDTLKESHQHLLASICELQRDNTVTEPISQHMMLTSK